jgi:hypothetical protein
MANDVTTQSATPATVPASTIIATVDIGSGRQVQAVTLLSDTGTQSSTAANAASVTVLASNTARLGATLYNDSASPVNVKLGATASATSFALRMSPGGYYEVPFGYQGVIDAIWDLAVDRCV